DPCEIWDIWDVYDLYVPFVPFVPPLAQKTNLAPNWNARGPPVPKTLVERCVGRSVEIVAGSDPSIGNTRSFTVTRIAMLKRLKTSPINCSRYFSLKLIVFITRRSCEIIESPPIEVSAGSNPTRKIS